MGEVCSSVRNWSPGVVACGSGWVGNAMGGQCHGAQLAHERAGRLQPQPQPFMLTLIPQLNDYVPQVTPHPNPTFSSELTLTSERKQTTLPPLAIWHAALAVRAIGPPVPGSGNRVGWRDACNGALVMNLWPGLMSGPRRLSHPCRTHGEPGAVGSSQAESSLVVTCQGMGGGGEGRVPNPKPYLASKPILTLAPDPVANPEPYVNPHPQPHHKPNTQP